MASEKAEKVRFTTEDGFTIIGNLIRSGKDAVLLMHQFQRDKSTFDSLAAKLARANFTTLAIDLRGHGESLEQKGAKRKFPSFSEQDFRNMVFDAKAACKFLEKQGFALRAVIGSSIGANTALNYSAQDTNIKKVVLLSPGMEYLGIEIETDAPKVRSNVLCVSSPGDSYSFTSCIRLSSSVKNFEPLEISGSEHGTGMFAGTELEDEIIEWLKN